MSVVINNIITLRTRTIYTIPTTAPNKHIYACDIEISTVLLIYKIVENPTTKLNIYYLYPPVVYK